MSKVDVFVCDVKKAKPFYKGMYEAISSFRKERADSYYHEDDKLRSVISAFLVKTFIKDEKLTYNQYGKPYVEGGLYFNVSHCANYVVLAISEQEVGVDIEEIKKRDLSFLKDILNKDLTEYDEKTQYQLWCCKESIVKCIGSGLSDIKEAPAEPINGAKRFKGEDFYTKSFIHHNYAFSITLKSKKEFDIFEHEVLLTKYIK